MKQYEYKIIYTLPERKSFCDMLNELGAQGWELISATNQPNSLIGYAILKRQLS